MTKTYAIMLQLIVKTGKIGFWVLLPLFLISNTNIAYESTTVPLVENGNYLFKATGALDRVFSGEIFFSESIDSLTGNTYVTRFELKLDSVDDTIDHHMGFVLSKRVLDTAELLGNYKVNTKSVGISNEVEGVFGFADIKILGEQPFFAEDGRLRITDMADGFLHGNLKMTLRNFEGRSIDISGNFVAKKRK